MKEAGHGYKERKREEAAAQVRVRYLDRWIERTRETGKPCKDASEIDYSD